MQRWKNISDLPVSEVAKHAALLVKCGGRIALDVRKRGGRDFLTFKLDGSPVTVGDVKVQYYLANETGRIRPLAQFRGEEDLTQYPTVASRFLTARTSVRMHPEVWIADPIDNTLDYMYGLPGWAISWGCIQYGTPVVGVVHAPEENGLLCIAERNSGVYYTESRSPLFKKGCIREWDGVCRPFVGHGKPFGQESSFDPFWKLIQPHIEHRQVVSCALGLAWVACGKIHAYMHGPVYGHDLLAGALAVAEADGDPMIQLYRIVDGVVRPLSALDDYSFDPRVPNTGVFAGNRQVVEAYFSKFCAMYHASPRVGSCAKAGSRK